MKQILLWTAIIFTLAWSPHQIRASQETSFNVEKLGEWAEGITGAVAAQGDIVYVGNGSQFQVIDYSNPSHAVFLANIPLTKKGGQVYDINVLNGLAYVTTKDELHVVDVTDPANPFVVLHQDVPYTFWVDASDNYIYASGRSVVRIMERSGGDELTQLSFYPDFGTPYPVVFAATSDAVGRGDYLYYGHGGLTVLDISDPSTPQVVGHDSQWSEGNTRIALQGDRVFMITGNLLRMYDVSDPANPSKIDSLVSSRSAWFYHVVPVGSYAYCSDGKYLTVVDVATGQPPAVVWEQDIKAGALAINGNDVFAICGSSVQALDVTNPQSPSPTLVAPTGSTYRDLTVDGDFAYIADFMFGLRVADITDPGNPFMVGHYCGGEWVDNVEIVENYAYVFGWASLTVLDISDPAEPVQAFKIPTPYPMASVAVGRDHFFVGKNPEGFVVLDISDPSRPQYISEYGVHLGQSPILALDGNLLFVVENEFVPKKYGRLRIIDVSDPANPNELGSCSLFDLVAFAQRVSFYPLDIAVKNGYVFLPSGNVGLRIIDATDPAAPREVKRFRSGSQMNGVTIAGNLLYAGGSTSYPSQLRSINVLNVTDPVNPIEVGRFTDEVKGRYGAIVIDRQTIYVTSNSDVLGSGEVIDLSILEFHRGRVKDEPKIELSSTLDNPAAGPALGGACPNPFNPSTTIRYTLPARARVSLAIYDVRGGLMTRLKDGWENAGEYHAEWNGRDANGVTAPSGVYFVRLEVGGDVQTRKITLLK